MGRLPYATLVWRDFFSGIVICSLTPLRLDPVAIAEFACHATHCPTPDSAPQLVLFRVDPKDARSGRSVPAERFYLAAGSGIEARRPRANLAHWERACRKVTSLNAALAFSVLPDLR